MILEIILGNKEKRKFRKALKEIKKSLKSDFAYQYVDDDTIRYAKETLSKFKLSLNDVKVNLNKLVEYFVKNGAEEVALKITEKFEYPLAERQSLAQKAYSSLKNHIKDSDFGGALFSYNCNDTLRNELCLARITKNYQIPGANLEDHVKEVRYCYKSIYSDASEEYIEKLVGDI